MFRLARSKSAIHRCLKKSLLTSNHLSFNRSFATRYTADEVLSNLGLSDYNKGVFNGTWGGNGPDLVTYNPSNNEPIATVKTGTGADYESCIDAMTKVKKEWSLVPAPKRGEVVRVIGEKIRAKIDYLGALVTLENGKILPEGVGEVQEAVDICDFAVGLSRSLNGSVMPSERAGHAMLECYNPLNGHLGIITAFNFPCAVAFWYVFLYLFFG